MKKYYKNIVCLITFLIYLPTQAEMNSERVGNVISGLAGFATGALIVSIYMTKVQNKQLEECRAAQAKNSGAPVIAIVHVQDTIQRVSRINQDHQREATREREERFFDFLLELGA